MYFIDTQVSKVPLILSLLFGVVHEERHRFNGAWSVNPLSFKTQEGWEGGKTILELHDVIYG